MKRLKLFAFATLLSSYCFGQWVTLPPNGATGGNLEAIWCLDTATCIAVGIDGIFKTTDGAQSWSSVSPSDYQFDVYFVNNMVGYTVGENGIGYKTIDGGDSWTQLFMGVNGHQCVHFLNDTVGIAGQFVGGNMKNTTDGGQTWNWFGDAWMILNGPIYSIFFTNDNDGYAVGGETVSQEAIIKTTNGGLNWSVVYTGGSIGTFRDVYFVNDSVGFVVTYDSILKTTDYGNNWGKVYQPASFNLRSIYCSTPAICYAAGTGSVKSIDQGDTWTLQTRDVAGANKGVRDIFFPNTDIGYAVGFKGTGDPFIMKITGEDTGTDDIIANNIELNIYPNPVGADKTINLMINSATPDNLSFTIYDLLGKPVLKKEILSHTQRIDLKEIQGGLYLFQLKNNNNVFAAGKIIVQ